MSNNAFKGMSYSLATRLSTTIFGLAGFLVLVKTMPLREFGIWNLWIAITAIMEVVRNGLIQNGFIYYYVKSGNSVEYIRQSFLLNLAYGLTASALSFGVGTYFTLGSAYPELGQWLQVYALVSLSLVPFFQSNYVDLAHQRHHLIFWRYLIRQGGMFLAIAGFGLKWYGVSELILLFAAVSVLPGLLIGKGVLNYFRISFPKMKEIAELLNYGKFSFLTNGIGMVFNSSDRLMLGMLSTPESVAVYSVGLKAIQVVEFGVTAMGQVYFSKFCAATKADAIKQLANSIGLMWAIMLPSLIALYFAWPLFMPFIGDGYTMPPLMLPLLLATAMLFPLTRQYGTYLDGIGKPEANFLMMLGATIINIALNYVLIINYSGTGAAAATFISITLLGIFILAQLKKQANLPVRTFFNETKNWYLALPNLISRIKTANR